MAPSDPEVIVDQVGKSVCREGNGPLSGPDFVLAFHSFPLWMNEAAPRSMNSTDAILVDKVLMITHLD